MKKKLKYSKCERKKSKYDRNQKSKCENLLKKSKCDKTQKLKIWQYSKTHMWQNSKCNKT